MLKNYFIVAWRHLTKNRVYTIINITGLATGMAVALLIGLWIADEFSYDHFFPNHKKIARALVSQTAHTESYTGEVVSTVMGQALQDQYKDLFSRTAMTAFPNDHILSYDDKIITGSGMYAQKDFPEMLGIPILQGSFESLRDASTAVISQELATALFGKSDPIGKTIKVDNQLPLRIGGVYANIPQNTSYTGLDMIMPWSNLANSYYTQNTNWDDHSAFVYVELQPGVTAEQATARVAKVPTPHIKEWREEAVIYPFDKWHLYNDFALGKPTGTGAIRYVWLFGLIGGFVLLLACINFMNLSTARSEKRTKEVGIRKTVGSLTKDLITQFLSESVLVAVLSLILALAMAAAALPFFNTLAAKDIHIPYANPLFWLAIAAFTLTTGLLAGSYPAFYLSRFKPVKVLKGPLKAGRSASLPRQILVVLQFTVSLTLVIGTIMVYRQVMYTKDRPVGYTREGLLTVDMNTPDLNQHYESLRTELIKQGIAENVAASSQTPTNFGANNGIDWRGKTHDQDHIMFNNVNVTPDYGRTIGWKILQGRDFSRDFLTDSTAMILNDTAAKIIGIKNPIGEIMTFYGRQFHVIGVAANMVVNSPYQKVGPAAFFGGSYVTNMIIRIKPGLATGTAMAKMEPLFKKYNPSSPFIYYFVDADYAKKFAAEQRIGNLASVFTLMAILISCLGLFGLAAFVAEQRTKEIGVRKVLGAGIMNLWGLLSKDFIRLTALSMLIAMPLAYLGMNKWLAGYPYHAPMSWWIFASAGAGLLTITLITVSFQSLKAALQNPVRSLRSE